MSLPRFQDGQEPLINRMIDTDHAKSAGGKCHGVAFKGMFAILGESLDQFDETMAFIYGEMQTKSISLKQLQQLIRREESMLGAIALFQDPQQHHKIFPVEYRHLNQALGPELLIPLLTPIELEQQGGIERVFDSTGATSVTELHEYFAQLQQLIDKQQIQDPLAFVISSSKHSIAVGYQPKAGKWVIIDANNLPSEIVESENIGQMTAEYLLSSSEFVSCRISAYAKKSSANDYKQCIAAWQTSKVWNDMHIPTKASCNIKNDFDTSWLHTAANEGNLEQVLALIEKGAEINAQDKDGWTPLKSACSHGSLEVAQVLLDHGADPTICDNEASWTPFMNAAVESHIEIMELLGKHAPKIIDSRGDNGITPLFAAAQLGNTEAVKLLIKLSADPTLPLIQTGDYFISFGEDEEKRDEMERFLFQQHASHMHTENPHAKSGTLAWTPSSNIFSTNVFNGSKDFHMTPKDIAEIMGHDEIFELLEEYELQSKHSSKKVL